MDRVVVTGVGAVTPIGNDAQTFWKNLLAGVSGVDRITAFDPSNLEVRIAAEVKDFDPRQFIDFKEARRMDRFSQFAVVATGEALRDARLEITPEDSERVGVMINTGGGGIPALTREVLNHHTKGPRRVSPFFIPMFAPNMAACQVSIAYDIHGPVMASVAACAAGTQAFVDALRMLRLGEVDVIIAGGTEAGMDPVSVAAFGNMGALSKRNDDPQHASRPFDRDRDGFVFGEGCGVLILEREAHARERGARIYCELAGGAVTADAFHISAPKPGGENQARAMQLALASAHIQPEDVDYICAHGTSTPLNDGIETAAIKQVFGPHAYELAVSSPKSMIGHLVGAAGAISGVICALTICHNLVAPTINLENPDEGCDLDYVPHKARHMQVDIALANAFGFGGQNAVAVFRRY
ncbi:MAG TPA: beta-ketoacyl-ACP synthase II, partial [Thermomicrobiaceae bacterium]|nr:beta-ketoacyl-ACP synthase II [Thermomicrobiaceae bacterium]